MKFGALFTFDTSHKKLHLRNKFYWNLYGRKHSSYFGKYFYEEKGLLSDLPHLRPTESVVIVNNIHASTIRNFLQSHKAKWSEHKIILSKNEDARLNKISRTLRKFHCRR